MKANHTTRFRERNSRETSLSEAARQEFPKKPVRDSITRGNAKFGCPTKKRSIERNYELRLTPISDSDQIPAN